MLEIDDVHRLLDEIASAIERLSIEPEGAIEVTAVPELCLVVNEISGWDRTAYSDMATAVGINPSILNRFLKMKGRVEVRTAHIVADRLKSYLRGLDQRTIQTRPQHAEPSPILTAPTSRIGITAEKWAIVHNSSEIKSKILAVSTLLDSIIEQTKKSNYPPEKQILTEIERQQLIAILETTIGMLRLPMAEKGLLRKARDSLGKAAASAAEKGIQQGLGKLAEVGAEKTTELIGKLFE